MSKHFWKLDWSRSLGMILLFMISLYGEMYLYAWEEALLLCFLYGDMHGLKQQTKSCYIPIVKQWYSLLEQPAFLTPTLFNLCSLWFIWMAPEWVQLSNYVFPKPQKAVCQFLSLSSNSSYSFKPRRLTLCMWPLHIWALVLGYKGPASEAVTSHGLFGV